MKIQNMTDIRWNENETSDADKFKLVNKETLEIIQTGTLDEIMEASTKANRILFLDTPKGKALQMIDELEDFTIEQTRGTWDTPIQLGYFDALAIAIKVCKDEEVLKELKAIAYPHRMSDLRLGA